MSRIVSAEEARGLLDVWSAHADSGAGRASAAPDLAATVVRLHEERDQAQIAAADLIEIIGETAWGIQLPTLFVRGPIMLPDGTIGTNAIPTALAPESAKQLVEHLYERVKTGRGWLREARHERDEARRERDRLRNILLSAVTAAKNATLPPGFIWGNDAMEQFNFGKECAAEAVAGALEAADRAAKETP